MGYDVLSKGTENGKSYVDAEVYWSYTANPYYLIPSENGYKISEIKERGRIEVTSLEGNKQVMFITDGNKQTHFTKSEIPQEFLRKYDKIGDFRISSFAYDREGKRYT